MLAFDSAPPPAWATRFAQAPLDAYRTHPSGRFRTEFGPVYFRGRLDGSARLLIVGQDPSTDEILAQRIFVGEAGQRVQGLLRKLGIVRDYLMLNSFLYGIHGQFDTTMRGISESDPFRAYRNQLLDAVVANNTLAAVLAFGAGAQHAVNHWPGHTALPILAFVHPTAPTGVTASWNANLTTLLATVAPEAGQTPDATPYGTKNTPADRAAIPRHDLPFGLPDWHGTAGTRSTRQGTDDQILWSVPGP
jgi:hypothetical protein